MAWRVYSVEQLISLRGNQRCNKLAAVARKKLELTDIIRPSSDRNVPPRQEQQTATKPKDSSSDSEEVLYKGSADRRAVSGETEWKYRGRSGSEITATEPLSAPAGLNAQQSEGFQKFYRAVVSPNHVRVTAGGRIVPNTRGPPSPTTKRTRERGDIDGRDNASPTHPTAPGGIGAFPMQPVLPQLYPGFPPIHNPVSLMPMAFGFPVPMPPGVPVMHPGAIPSPGLQAQGPADSTLRDTLNLRQGETRASQSPEKGKEATPKAPGPGPADPPKAFFFNGQWVTAASPNLQAPLGTPFMPLNMVANPNLHIPQMPGQPVVPPTNVGMSPMMGQFGFQPGQPSIPGFAGLPHPNVAPLGVFPAPTAPPISSIRPSEITRNQLQQLRISLKYNEDQLQWNRHQIDEGFTEDKIKTLREQLQRFNSLLRVQLAHEDAYYPKASGNQETRSFSAPVDNPAPESAPGLAPGPEPLSHASPGRQEIPVYATHRKRDNARQRVDIGVNAGSGLGGEVTFQYDPTAMANEFGDPVKKSALPSDAALAPPFKPGSGSLAASGPGLAQTGTLVSGSCLSPAWSTSANPVLDPPHMPPSNAPTPQQTSLDEEPEMYGFPYLIGTLPLGTNPATAADTDYVYPRSLTQDEIRARFLYWGKAPRSVRQGLPKYDGKNFYPSSPVENAAVPEPIDTRNIPLPASQPDTDQPFNYPKRVMDPFQPRSRSDEPEALHGSELRADGPSMRRFRSFRSQVDSSSEDLEQALEASIAFEDAPVQTSAATGSETDAPSVESREKRSDKSSVKLWQAMLKKGPSSSAVSSATAKGSRSQFVGQPTASLSPTLTNAVLSPGRHLSPSKTADISGGARLTPLAEKRDENRPPAGSESLEDHFRSLAVSDAKSRSGLPPPPFWK